MSSKLHSLLSNKVNSALLAVVLCFSVLGLQAVGLFHGVHHVNQEQSLQHKNGFEVIDQGFTTDLQKSKSVCNLLDSLLLGASVASPQIKVDLLSYSHIAPITIVLVSISCFQYWPYQSQAPPTI